MAARPARQGQHQLRDVGNLGLAPLVGAGDDAERGGEIAAAFRHAVRLAQLGKAALHRVGQSLVDVAGGAGGADRMLRPALVAVAKGGGKAPPANDNPTQ